MGDNAQQGVHDRVDDAVPVQAEGAQFPCAVASKCAPSYSEARPFATTPGVPLDRNSRALDRGPSATIKSQLRQGLHVSCTRCHSGGAGMRRVSLINLLVGIWLLIAPFTLNGFAHATVAANDVVLGFLLIATSWWALAVTAPSTSVAWFQALCGLW